MGTAWMLLGAVASAGDAAWEREGYGFGALPAVNFNTDDGLGLGALGSLYRYDGRTSPYRFSVTGLVFFTSKGVHNHWVQFDALKLAGGRLRINGRVQFDATRSNPFCGIGRDVTCDPAEAEAEAAARGLTGEAADEFVRTYYFYAFIRPSLFLQGRYRLGDLDAKVNREVFGTLRTAWFQPGGFDGSNPFPGNKMSERIAADPDAERGLLNLLQVGVMADTRDFESAPSSGYWVEASVRGAHSALGSDFDLFAFNTTLRGYLPLAPEGRLVSATRVAFDGMFGDAPARELAQMGGATIYDTGGGLNAGRGIRQRRFLGRFKGLVQPELRWKFWHVEPFGVKVDFTLLGFADVLFVAEDHRSLLDFARPVVGEGAGLRLAFDDNFIVRFDGAVSASEDYSPAIYIDINHLF